MKKSSILAALFLLFLCSFSTNMKAQRVGIGVNITLPYWAPQYDNIDRVQYYYLPDIESYYDVRNQEFVYLHDGNWLFSPQLPPYYSWYNFDNPFVVMLDYSVVQPWMHHNFYVEHYPRYYYRTVYRNAYNDPVRPILGFNENARAVVYRNANARPANEVRRDPINRERAVESTHAPQRVEHAGKNIGHPVKVQKDMKRGRDDDDRRH